MVVLTGKKPLNETPSFLKPAVRFHGKNEHSKSDSSLGRGAQSSPCWAVPGSSGLQDSMGHSPAPGREGSPLLRVAQRGANTTQVSPAGGVDLSGERIGP